MLPLFLDDLAELDFVELIWEHPIILAVLAFKELAVADTGVQTADARG